MKVLKLSVVAAVSTVLGSFSIPLMLGMGPGFAFGLSMTIVAGLILVGGTIYVFMT